MTEPQTDRLTHLSERGEARMVDISDKAVTVRQASARGFVELSADCLAVLRADNLPKGDALAVARIAGIMAAKKTPELIPLCHPLPLTGVEVSVELVTDGAEVVAQVRTSAPTGVEMEALTATSVACCALIDMVKGVDRLASIQRIEVTQKSGGRSGDWHRED